MKVLIGEGLDGERGHVGDLSTVIHPLIQLREDVVVAAYTARRLATTVVSMATTYLLELKVHVWK